VPKIQILSIEALLAGKKPPPPDPSRGEQPFKKERREERDGNAHQPSLDFSDFMALQAEPRRAADPGLAALKYVPR